MTHIFDFIFMNAPVVGKKWEIIIENSAWKEPLEKERT